MKNTRMKRIFMIVASFCMLLLPMASYARSIFNITTTTPSVQIPIGSTQNVSFTVTNNTSRSSSVLSVYLANAPHSSLGSGNTCTSPLAPNGSCTLQLAVQAPNQVTSFTLTPKICGFGGLACSIPNPSNIITVHVNNSSTSDQVYLPVTIGSFQSVLNVIDSSNDSVSTVFNFTDEGIFSVVTPDGKKVYNITQSGLLVYYPQTQTSSLISIADLGERMGMTPDGTKIYIPVGPSGSTVLKVLDTATDTFIATIPFDGATFAFTPNSATAYSGERGSNNLAVIDTATNTITTTIVLPAFASGMAVTPDGSKLYIGDFNKNIDIVNTATNTIISTTPFSVLMNFMVFSLDGSKLYTAPNGTAMLNIVDPVGLTITKTITLGGGDPADNIFGLGITSDGKKLYASGGPFTSPTPKGFVNDISTETETVTNTMLMGTMAFTLGIGPGV